jgi:hypothetical protein
MDRNNYIEIHPTQAQVAKISYHHPSKYHSNDKNVVHGEKSDFLGQLTEKIRGCGVSFYIWTKKGTRGELDWSSDVV